MGIWHFILLERPDNIIGRGTYLSWFEEPAYKGDKWKFISNIGKAYSHEIKISTSYQKIENADESEIEYEEDTTSNHSHDDVIIIDEVTDDEQRQPSVNNQFNFYGSRTNIGQATNIVIENGKVVKYE